MRRQSCSGMYTIHGSVQHCLGCEVGPALVRKLEAAEKMAQALRVAIHNCTWKWGSQMNEADEALAAWDSASAPAPQEGK